MNKLMQILTKELRNHLSVRRDITIKQAYDLCKDTAIRNGVDDSNMIDKLAYDAIINVSANIDYNVGE